MRTFGRGREKAWRALARRLGGEFVDGGFHLEDEVTVPRGVGTVRLRFQWDGEVGSTQLLASCAHELKFRLKSRGFLLRMWNDNRYAINGKDAPTAHALLENPNIRRLIELQPSVNLRADGGQLHFERSGSLNDVEKLVSLFDLFDEVLRELKGAPS